jgi:hypothetical protein
MGNLWAVFAMAGAVAALSFQTALAQEGPCRQIRSACEKAGFEKGKAKEGRGLHADCIRPVMQGTARRPKAAIPLPSVDPQLIAACKEKRPNFAQPKGAPGQPIGQAEPSEEVQAPAEAPHAESGGAPGEAKE